MTNKITKEIQKVFKETLKQIDEISKKAEIDDEYEMGRIFMRCLGKINFLWRESDKLEAETFFITFLNECKKLTKIEFEYYYIASFHRLFEDLFQLGNTHPDYLAIIEKIIIHFLDSISSYSKDFVVFFLALISENTSRIKKQEYVKKFSFFISEMDDIELIASAFAEYMLGSYRYRQWSRFYFIRSKSRTRKVTLRWLPNKSILEDFLDRFLQDESVSNHWMIIEQGIISTIENTKIQKNLKIKATHLLEKHGRSRGEIPLLNLLKDESNSEMRIATLDALGTVGSPTSLYKLINISKTADSRESDKAREVLDKIALKHGYQDRFELIKAQQPKKLTFTEIIRTAGLIVSLLGVFVNSLVSRIELTPRNETIITSFISIVVLSIIILLIVLIIKKRVEISKFEKKTLE